MSGHSIHENATVLSPFGLDCAMEVGGFALGHVNVPTFDHSRFTMLDERAVESGGVGDENLLVRRRHPNDETVNVGQQLLLKGGGLILAVWS